MKHSNTDTILYYLPDRDPSINVIREFADKHHLKIYKSDAISDILAVPYMLAIVHERYLTERLLHFMRRPEYVYLFNNEQLIITGSAGLPDDLHQYFLVPKKITIEMLEETLSTVDA